MESAPVRIAMVGAGGVATRHAAALRAMAGVDLVGVTDVDPSRAAALADACGTVAAPGVSALVDRRPDALYICVPPFAHGEPEMAAIEAGVPFFVEKPLSVDPATAESIAAAVAATGLLTATGYHWRYYDTVQEVADAAAQRPVRLALACWLDKVPPVDWWSHRARSGGQVVEQVTHVLDLLRVLVGEVTEVHAVGRRFRDGDGDVDDATVATLLFATGAVGSLAATSLLSAKHRTGVELYGDGLAVSLEEDHLRWHGTDAPARAPSVDARTAADLAFVEALRTGDRSLVLAPYAEAVRTHRLACAVAQATTGRRVHLEEWSP